MAITVWQLGGGLITLISLTGQSYTVLFTLPSAGERLDILLIGGVPCGQALAPTPIRLSST